MGVAKLDEARAFGMLGNAALKRHGAHFIDSALGWTHGNSSIRFSLRLFRPVAQEWKGISQDHPREVLRDLSL
jgi:hypothetical protein